MEVLSYRSVNKGNLVGFMNLKVSKWGVTLNDLAIFQKNGHRWINMPARQYEDQGEKKFFAYIRFDTPELRDAFAKKALDTLDEYCKNNTPQEPPPSQENHEEAPF